MNSIELEYKKINKILYVWNGGNPSKWYVWDDQNIKLLVDFCQIHGFTEVHVFVGSSADTTNGWMRNNQDQFKNLFAALTTANINIYTMFYDYDDPNTIPQPNTPVGENYKNLITILTNLKKDPKYSRLKGISYDQEPSNAGIYQNFQDRVTDIINYTHQSGFGFGISLKIHWFTLSTLGVNIINKLTNQDDRPILMDYLPWKPLENSQDNQEAYQDVSEKYVIPLMQKLLGPAKINIALETETDAFSGGLPVNAFSGNGTIKGLSPEDFWKTVVNLNKKYEESVNFGNIAIHQYGNSPKGVGYFEDMYLENPWTASVPLNLAVNPSNRR